MASLYYALQARLVTGGTSISDQVEARDADYAGEGSRRYRRDGDRCRGLRGAKADSGHGDVHIATDDLHK